MSFCAHDFVRQAGDMYACANCSQTRTMPKGSVPEQGTEGLKGHPTGQNPWNKHDTITPNKPEGGKMTSSKPWPFGEKHGNESSDEPMSGMAFAEWFKKMKSENRSRTTGKIIPKDKRDFVL